jgi:2-polyprenyl-3-methyl-5-hydroxy-6-metoxy-1,4-benzoquinol methylase
VISRKQELSPGGIFVGKVMLSSNCNALTSASPALTASASAPRKIWPWPKILIETAAAWIKARPGDVWLDAACGEGPLAEHLGKQKRLIGLDFDQPRLLRARETPFHSLTQASVTHLPFAENALDGVVSIETLEHVADFSAALREFSRCVKPNGYFLVTMPAVTLRSWWGMHRTGQPVYCSETQHVRELSAVPIGGFRHRFKSFRWLEAHLAAAGFTVAKRSGVGFLLPMWSGRLSFIEHGMNLFYREGVNRLLAAVPGIERFPYYRMVLARRVAG